MVTDKTRRSTFIEQNLGLVHSCAGRFRGRGIEYDDLYSAGCMGLVKAYDGFDESRGVCFSTYAVPVILGETLAFIARCMYRMECSFLQRSTEL